MPTPSPSKTSPTSSDCSCTALYTNLNCAKHAPGYLLSYHRSLPNPVIRLDILTAIARYEAYHLEKPDTLYITEKQWRQLIEVFADESNFPATEHPPGTRIYLGMEVEFIPRGDLRVSAHSNK